MRETDLKRAARRGNHPACALDFIARLQTRISVTVMRRVKCGGRQPDDGALTADFELQRQKISPLGLVSLSNFGTEGATVTAAKNRRPGTARHY
jgi:hypothetical protein